MYTPLLFVFQVVLLIITALLLILSVKNRLAKEFVKSWKLLAWGCFFMTAESIIGLIAYPSETHFFSGILWAIGIAWCLSNASSCKQNRN